MINLKLRLDIQDDATKERLKPYLFENFNTSEALEEFQLKVLLVMLL